MNHNKYEIFNDISKSKKRLHALVKLVIVLFCLVCIASSYIIYLQSENTKNNIYLLDNGTKLSLIRSKSYKESADILFEGHLRNFHELFFALEPDIKYIKRNIEEKALYMIDNSGARLYNSLIDDKYFQGVVMGRYSVDLEIDSIKIDYSSTPYRFLFSSKQKITKDGDVSYRSLITKGQLRQTSRTPNNLNGLIIEKFRVVDNKNIIK